MKLKYIIPFFMAVLAVLSGCSNDQDPTYQDGLRVSQSYVTLPLEGGTSTISLTADNDWAFDAADIPAWLTVSPMSGAAGTATITFTVTPGQFGQVVKLHVRCGGLVQEINVQQGLPTPELATCAEVAAGPDGKQFRVKGRVTAIKNTTYGNWDLTDDTGSIYIYGTLDKDGKTKNFGSLNIEVGDVVTVEGPKKDYNGTIELVDVTVVNIEKTLVKVLTEPTTVGKEGGDVEVEVEYKGIGLIPTIDPACTWIHQTNIRLEEGTVTAVDPNPANKAFITFTIDANEGGSRKAAVELKSIKDGNESTVTYTIEQEANVLPHGQNPDDPYTIAEAIAKCQEIGGTSDGVIYYAKGTISSIDNVNTQYGNATFNVSDDGTETGAITCFRSKFLNNEAFTAADQIEVGSEVIMCGKLVHYKGETPEFSGNVYIYKYTKVTNDPGSKKNPFTAAQANAYCKTLTPGNPAEDAPDFYVKGKIVKYANNGEFGTQYGNASFYISDDGQETSEQFYVFRTLYLGNVKYADDSWVKPAVGDEVVICGKLMLYEKNGTQTPETAANKSYIYSLNGQTN